MTDREKLLTYMLKRYEDELLKVLGMDGYQEFMSDVAKETFNISIHNMTESEFKHFCLDNFDLIVGNK